MWEDVRRCEKMWEDVRRCEKMWEDVRRWEDVLQTPTIGRTLRSDALGKQKGKGKKGNEIGRGRACCRERQAWTHNKRRLWPEWRLANSRLERPNNDGLWTQTAGWKALSPECLWQDWTPYNSRGPWRETAGFKALWPDCLVEAAAGQASKL